MSDLADQIIITLTLKSLNLHPKRDNRLPGMTFPFVWFRGSL